MAKTSRIGIMIAATALLIGGAGAGTQPATRAAPAASAESHANLRQLIPELNLESTTLEGAIETLRKATGANLVVHWDAVDRAGFYRDAPVKLHMWDVTLGRALSAIFSVAGGGPDRMYAVQDGIIVIAPSDQLPNAGLEPRVYDVRDLVDTFVRFRASRPATRPAKAPAAASTPSDSGAANDGTTPGEAVQNLSDLIEQDVVPDAWKNNGGTGEIREFAGLLVITQTPANHKKIADFLRTLRAGGSKEGTELPGNGR